MRTTLLVFVTMLMVAAGVATAEETTGPRTFVNRVELVFDGVPTSDGVLELHIEPRDGDAIVGRLNVTKGMRTKELALKMAGVLVAQVKGAYEVEAKGSNRVRVAVPKKAKDTPPVSVSFSCNVLDLGVSLRRD